MKTRIFIATVLASALLFSASKTAASNTPSNAETLLKEAWVQFEEAQAMEAAKRLNEKTRRNIRDKFHDAANKFSKASHDSKMAEPAYLAAYCYAKAGHPHLAIHYSQFARGTNLVPPLAESYIAGAKTIESWADSEIKREVKARQPEKPQRRTFTRGGAVSFGQGAREVVYRSMQSNIVVALPNRTTKSKAPATSSH